VGTGSSPPEVPELPSAWEYNRATRPQGDLNSGDWPSRLGVGCKTSDITLENTSCYEISNKSDLSEEAKHTKGCCGTNGGRRKPIKQRLLNCGARPRSAGGRLGRGHEIFV
jgi:hypothetical protein